MKPFNCLSLHHLITHRLSRIETCNYQDKAGCSLNGSNEFLKETGFVQYNGIHPIIFDSRGVVVSFEDGNICHHSQELDEIILNFKQFVGIVTSTISIVEEERETLKVALLLVDRYMSGVSYDLFQSLVQDPTNFFNDNQSSVITCFGHVISLESYTQPIVFDSHNFEEIFSSFEQLTHLRSLNCIIINDFHEVNTQILDEFGSSFGSKLSYLSISFINKFSSNQLEDCFSQFTRLKHLVLQKVPKFHPSFH